MMRTRSSGRTAWPVAVAWAFAGALALSLAQPSEAAAQSECGEYISGGPNNPMSGTLVGSQTVRINVGVIPVFPFRLTLTFDAGVYRMDDGSIVYVRCDDHVEWGFQ